MKKIKLIATTLFCLWIAVAYAQPGPPDREKREQIEAMKVAFLTRKLDFTPDEAKVFWPVYNQYQDEIEKLRENRHKDMRAARDEFDTMADKDVEKLVDGEIAFRQAEIDVLKKYNPQFKKVLPMKKVAKLYRAEEDFKRELLQKLQERRGGGGPPPRKD
ncbi:MAG TPA: hypothetical protein PKD91_09580 [Bacteroidia bacterium]|nr:hypothetical protein [Bacteroidia bacterium]